MNKMMKAAAGVLVLAGITQASVVSKGTFVKTETSTTAKPNFTSASSSGFTTTYTNAPVDSRWYAYSTLNGGSQALAVGESLEFSFDWASTQIKNVSSSGSAFAFGFDTGTGLFKVMVDTQPAFSFINMSYGDTYPFGAGTSVTNFSVATGATLPASSAYLAAGNTPTLKTTLTRTADTAWTLSLLWGGQTYSTAITGYSTDGTIDQVWISSGALSGSYFDTGDNYTISGASVNLIPEPATIGMLGLGAAAVLLLRRMRK
jgi:hypothetical protein